MSQEPAVGSGELFRNVSPYRASLPLRNSRQNLAESQHARLSNLGRHAEEILVHTKYAVLYDA